MSRADKIINVMRAHPARDSWSVAQYSAALGIDPDKISDTVARMVQRGTLVKNARSYSLSAALQKTDNPTVRAPIVKATPPAGPCPQSDALLRLMRGTGGAKSCRQWAAIWAERDTLTQQMLDKLVDRGLIGQMNGMYRA